MMVYCIYDIYIYIYGSRNEINNVFIDLLYMYIILFYNTLFQIDIYTI